MDTLTQHVQSLVEDGQKNPEISAAVSNKEQYQIGEYTIVIF